MPRKRYVGLAHVLAVKPTYTLDHAELWHCANERFVIALPRHVSSRVIMARHDDAGRARFATQGSVYVVEEKNVQERTVSSYADVEAAKARVTDDDARV